MTAFLLLLAFPPLEAAGVMQLMDKVAHTSFFLPTGLAVGGTLANISGGGSPLLWQHLFWFLGHPEVYVLILPAMGIVAEIIANNTRKPIWGYKSLVYSALTIGFLSFIVWAHHMYLTGMGTKIATFFQTTTMIISIPSVIILTCLFHLAVGRVDPLQHADAVRDGVPADVRHWWSDGFAAGLQLQRSASARHVLRHRALPLHRRAGNDFRAVCGNLLLVSENDRPDDERILGQGAFLGFADFHEPDFPADVRARHGGHVAPHVGWRRELFAARKVPDADRRLERHDACDCTLTFCGRQWASASSQIPFIFNFFWSIKQRQESRVRIIPGRRPRWNGKRRRRRRTAISPKRRRSIAALTNTACRVTPTDFTPQNEPERTA